MQREKQLGPARFGQLVADTLVHRAQRGDMAAHSEIYELFSEAVMALACSYCRNLQAAEDVVHDTFIKVIDKVTLFQFRAPFGMWLRQIAVNESLTYLRKHKKHNWVSTDEFDFFETDNDANQAMALFSRQEDITEQHGAQHDLSGVLRQLPEHVRLILWLKEVEGYTHKEIADLVGMTPSYSKSVVARGFEFLRRRMGVKHNNNASDVLNQFTK